MPEGRVLSKDIQGYRDAGEGREIRDGRREREGGKEGGRGEERRGERGTKPLDAVGCPLAGPWHGVGAKTE